MPSAFYIPPAYSHIIEKLKLHGIKVDKVTENVSVPLTQAIVKDYSFAKAPFEGRFRVDASFDYTKVDNLNMLGWYKVSTEQPYSELATHLLHPEAPDSFFAWGDFNTIFQRTEYVENYALEPYARSMLKNNPAMAHDHSNSVLLSPGEKGELVWKFNNKAKIEAACNVPGHYEVGMIAKISEI